MERYMKIFATSGDVQTAINNGELSKPYVAYIEDGQYIDWNSKSVDYAKKYFTIEAIESGAITIKYDYYSYSLNGAEWTQAQENENISVVPGDKIMIKNINSWNYKPFSTNFKFNAYGNIMSLVKGDNFLTDTTLSAYYFLELFYGQKIVSASNLILPNSVYNRLYDAAFKNCSYLTSAPVLPATNLTGAGSCYRSMFEGCSSLQIAPELPATTLSSECYRTMFANCTSLTDAPALPATTLATYCYADLFNGCTSLTGTPSTLPATTLQQSCYARMFYNCSNLTTAPELPAATLATACYDNLFRGCSNLNYIKCLAETFAPSSTTNWVISVAATGTFVTPSSTSWGSGSSGIPNNWTRVNA